MGTTDHVLANPFQQVTGACGWQVSGTTKTVRGVGCEDRAKQRVAINVEELAPSRPIAFRFRRKDGFSLPTATDSRRRPVIT